MVGRGLGKLCATLCDLFVGIEQPQPAPRIGIIVGLAFVIPQKLRDFAGGERGAGYFFDQMNHQQQIIGLREGNIGVRRCRRWLRLVPN